MNGKRFQLNGRKAISLLLALLILALAAAPALAGPDEGDGGFQSSSTWTIAQADEEMGYLSLKVAGYTGATELRPFLVRAE